MHLGRLRNFFEALKALKSYIIHAILTFSMLYFFEAKILSSHYWSNFVYEVILYLIPKVVQFLEAIPL